MACRGDAKLAVSVYDNRVITGDWYTRNTGDKASFNGAGIADADEKSFVDCAFQPWGTNERTVTGGCLCISTSPKSAF